jgi:hypothetical protein
VKILQWTPAYNDTLAAGVSAQFRWDAVSAYAAGHDMVSKTTHGCVLHQMRNEIADEAIRDSYDVLFMQDADNYSPIPGGPLMRMIGSMIESDAVACFAAIPLRNMDTRINVQPFHPGKVHDVVKGGTGMVAINLNMIRPWYADYPGPLFAPIFADAKQTKIKMGMDIFFSNLMRLETPHKPAHKLIADCRIPTVHINAIAKLEFNGLAEPLPTAIPTPGATAEATPDEER